MRKKDFLKELTAAENAEIIKYYDLQSAEMVTILCEAAKRSAIEQDEKFHAALLAFKLGYERGFKAGTNKAKAPRKRREMVPLQGLEIKGATEAERKRTRAEMIQALYSPEEICSTLKRLKKGSLDDLTETQAARMILKRADTKKPVV